MGEKEKSPKTIGFQGFGGDWGTRKSRCRFRRAGIEQMSAGHLHLVIRVPISIKQKRPPKWMAFFLWWRLGDSNPRPHACEACALTS